MKKLLLILSVFISTYCSGQAPLDTNRVRQLISAYGYDWNSGGFKQLVLPRDTFKLKVADSGSVAVINATAYMWTGYFWKQSSGAGIGAVQTTIAGLRGLFLPQPGLLYQVTDRYKEGFFYWDQSDNTTVDDSAVNITAGSGGSKRVFKRIFQRSIYPEWWGVVPDPTTSANATGPDAGPGLNKMFRWMERMERASYEVRFQSNNYYVSTTVKLPYTLVSRPNDNHPYLQISGNGVTLRTNAAITILDRMPASDFDAGTMNDSYKLLIEGLSLVGDRSTDRQNGINISCMYGGEFRHMQFTGLDTAFIGNFLTKSTISDCFFGVQKRTDILLRSLYQLIPGGAQTIPGSATNMCKIENCRFFKETGSYAAIDLRATDNTVIEHNIIEGAQPRYGIASDYLGSTVTNTLIINDLWFEGYSNSPSVNFKIAGAGLTRISNVQRTYQDTLFDFTSSQSGAAFLLDAFTYAGNMATVPFIAGASNPNMSGQSIRVTNSDPQLTDLLYTASSWKDNTVPFNLTSDFYQGANNGYTISNGTNIEFQPSKQLGDGSGFVVVRGNVVAKNDNAADYIGGVPGANYRFKGGYFGDGGLFVDPSGRLRWGTAVSNGDLSLVRDSVGQLGVKDSTFGYKNIKAARGLFTTRSGYTTLVPWDSLGSFDFIPKGEGERIVDGKIDNYFQNHQPHFDPNLMAGNGEVGSEYSADSTNWYGTKWDVTVLHTRLDSIINHWPAGGPGGGNTTIFHTSSLGDSVLVKINDSTYKAKKFRTGPNISFTVTDSTITINGIGGAAEINTKDSTLTTTGSITIAADKIIQFILIKPVSDLTAFKAGYSVAPEALVSGSPATGGIWTVFQVNEYLDATTPVLLSGITVSTEIQIVTYALHR